MKWLLAAMMWFAVTSALAAVERPEFDPQLGCQIDTTVVLTDETGHVATFRQITGGKPALVLFGYHDCPNQCGVAQQVIATALAKTGLGTSVVPLFITLAPEEGPSDAAAAKGRLIDALGDPAKPWHFLSGPDVAALGEKFGIGTIERERIRQFVHPVAVFTLTPDGRISHVLPGLDLTANDLRLALVEASGGGIGTVIDHIMLWCAGYDASAGKYTTPVIGALRIGAIGTVVLGLAGLAVLELRKRRWTA
ncbi:MAG TPA: SCO family protein [Hyphomicrobiaceae bacterium]|nr:SCO family protein [Hyphomicrobiaceae bacterium]